MKDQKLQKTNVYRLLDQAGAVYTQHYYGDTEAVSGTEVAEALHEDPDRVFKTLVTAGRSGEHYVFMIPVAEELDLRKAASAAGEKSVGMIKAKELLPLTGYIHGGCSPIGMKKQFATFVDETAVLYDTVFFSAGKIGYQVEMSVSDLEAVIPLKYADLTEERR
ncbi:MAG: Cys-tRNA(Pro) deacylase [Oscillospiraceae bacterium]|jgi:Cys-tRNA(Pro)/Cys-tRNA(Cys) deacylase|nr:Cys-tRNA(Pro) deacylase [Oscillospiraceae bacterium]MBQ5489312.1 Cys-tRNA(Pro) deacylase [Oscillospiraceae bacterium]